MSKKAGAHVKAGRKQLEDAGVNTMKRLMFAEPEEPSLHKHQRNLFPGTAISGHSTLIKEQYRPSVVDSHTMTLMYAGAVLVYGHVPPSRAQNIMLFAAEGNADPSMKCRDSVFLGGYQQSNSSAVGMVTEAGNADEPLIQRSYTELPFARKISLARFLKKRKERIQAKAIMMRNRDSIHDSISPN